MAVRKFIIITDHKNLRYFTTIRRLNERQMRWADTLSAFNFELEYRPGKQAIVPDALSRREQDVPKDGGDERLRNREKQLFSPDDFHEDGQEVESHGDAQAALCLSVRSECSSEVAAPVRDDAMSLEEQWQAAEEGDEKFHVILKAVRDGLPKFPKELQLQLNIGECEFDAHGRLLWRQRRWVPENEPLRTRIMQECHDSIMSGHPGHNSLYGMLARTVFWPNMSADVKRFCDNCDLCGSTRVWRERRHGLLKPLPVPDRKWRQISLDFVERLPETERGNRHALVIVDRLSKGPIFAPLANLETETVARTFVTSFVGYHGLPATMVSDRGSQFVGDLWATLCRKLGITRQLSTAFHPQTDGQTERMNAEMERFVRNFCDHDQGDWDLLLPLGQLALANRDSASIGTSPFFLDHGYNLEVLELQEPGAGAADEVGQQSFSQEQGERIATKLRDALTMAQAEMAAAQQRQESYANRHRQLAPHYRAGDRVWLDLRNIRTDRPSKKLDARNAKYEVVEKVSPYAYRLNTPGDIHPVFHVDKLRPATENPFPSQRNDDYQPPGELIDGEVEWEVEDIVDQKDKRVGRGWRRMYEVKWVGYRRTTWEPLSIVEDTAALDRWEARRMEEGGIVTG